MAVEYQAAGDFAYAFIAQLLLHPDQAFLVENRISAADPVNIALQGVALNRAVAFELGCPAVIAAQGFKCGKRCNQLHGRCGVDRHIRTVVDQDVSAVQFLNIHGNFVLRDAAEIDGKCRQREDGQP